MTVATLRKRALQTRKRIDELERKKEQLEKQAVVSCRHPVRSIVETDYSSGAPWRLCEDCGYAEEGWGCGYWKLAPRVYSDLRKMDWYKLMDLRTISYTQKELSDLRFSRKRKSA